MKAWELVQRGWCQGHSTLNGVGGMCYCPLGAIYKAYTGDFAARDGAIGRLAVVISKRLGFPAHIVDWNDAPERKQAEVVAMMKEADV